MPLHYLSQTYEKCVLLYMYFYNITFNINDANDSAFIKDATLLIKILLMNALCIQIIFRQRFVLIYPLLKFLLELFC